MKHCWDPIPANRPTASKLFDYFFDWHEIVACYILDEPDNNRVVIIRNAFSQEREEMWKSQLAKSATNPKPLKKSQNLLTSKKLNYSEQLTQLLKIKYDTETEINYGMLFCLNFEI